MFFRSIFVILALVGIAMALRVVRAGEQQAPPALPVAQPAGPPFASYVAGSGIIEASSRNLAIGAAVPGTVEEVFVEAGSAVKRGDALLRLDTRQVKAQLAVATAAVDSAEANLRRLKVLPRPEDVVPLRVRVAEAQALLDDARSRLAMWQSIEDPRAVTRDEVDRRKYAVIVAEAKLADAEANLATTLAGAWAPDVAIARTQVESAKAERQRVQTELERLTVRSPVDGEVLQLNVRLGEYAVAGTVATPLLLLGTVDPLHVRVDVDENDAWRVTNGSPAVAFLRGNTALRTDLRFVRFEPYVVPKRSLTGDSTERVDTRVLQVIYAFDRASLPAYVGQQVDVFIEAPASGAGKRAVMIKPSVGPVLVLLLLVGCKVGPEYQPPVVDLPSGFIESTKTFEDAPPAAAQLVGWWQTFDDPALESLVVRAVGSNLDLRIAQQRVFEARGLRRVAAADFHPQVDAVGGFTRRRQSENLADEQFVDVGPSNLWDGSFDADWEIDVFGRTQRSVEAASADIRAAESLHRDTLVTLVAEVARNYAELRGFQRRLELASRNADEQRDFLGLTESRFRAGLVSELDVASAEAQLAATEAALPTFRQGIVTTSNRVGVLLGEPPERLRDELAAMAPIPVGPANIDPGDPLDLLSRRPDLRRAQELAAAECARVGVATADLYPRFFLLGSVGLAAQDFSNLFEGASRTYSFGPAITWQVFDGGRIRGNIAAQDARFEQAQLAYRQAVLTALEEVENALAAHRHDQESARSLAVAVEANTRRVKLATDRYERGIGDYLSVLDAQRALTIAEDDLARTRQNVATDLIALYKALGGV